MKITNYEDTGLIELERILDNPLQYISFDSIKELLKMHNIAFCIENANRLQSMLICELNDSYVQQSQRYVTVSKDGYSIPEFLINEDKEEYSSFVEKAMNLYERMSELGVEKLVGRPKPEDYKYGIPIEDARYILPVCVNTNISVAMNASKLVDLFKILNEDTNNQIFGELKNELSKFIPNKLYSELCSIDNNHINYKNDLFKDVFDKISSSEKVVKLNSFVNPETRIGLGAVTSTQSKTTSEVIESWGEELQTKAKNVTTRVLGYGHTGISEQSRHTFGIMLSICSYHQFIRHRLPINHRENLESLVMRKNDIIIPYTIKGSVFEKEYCELVNEIQEFRTYLFSKYNSIGIAGLLLLNCDYIKVITSTNARIDCEIMVERLCMTAQWEIREIYEKKYELLAPTAPEVYKKAIPPCVYGACKEGKLTCGKANLVKEKYQDKN